MGSIKYPLLNKLTRKIWEWCQERNLFIFASYIKSSENKVADQESRNLEINTEWEINSCVFQQIKIMFGEPKIDLFATRNNKKCNKFVSWLRDPEAYAVDAFTLDWSKYFFYAFPPFSLVLRTLKKKVVEDKAEGILVVPYWTAQPWYPIFSSLLTCKPIIFKPDVELLSFNSIPHPLWKKLSLVVGRLSYKHCDHETSQKNP